MGQALEYSSIGSDYIRSLVPERQFHRDTMYSHWSPTFLRLRISTISESIKVVLNQILWSLLNSSAKKEVDLTVQTRGSI